MTDKTIEVHFEPPEAPAPLDRASALAAAADRRTARQAERDRLAAEARVTADPALELAGKQARAACGCQACGRGMGIGVARQVTCLADTMLKHVLAEMRAGKAVQS